MDIAPQLEPMKERVKGGDTRFAVFPIKTHYRSSTASPQPARTIVIFTFQLSTLNSQDEGKGWRRDIIRSAISLKDGFVIHGP